MWFFKTNHLIWFIHMITIWKLFCIKWDFMTISIQLTTNVPVDLHIPIAFEFSVRQGQGVAMAITVWGKELLKPILKCVNLLMWKVSFIYFFQKMVHKLISTHPFLQYIPFASFRLTVSCLVPKSCTNVSLSRITLMNYKM